MHCCPGVSLGVGLVSNLFSQQSDSFHLLKGWFLIFHRGYPRSSNSAEKELQEHFFSCGCHNFFIHLPYLDHQIFTSVGTKNTPDSRCKYDQQSDQLCQAVVNWYKLTVWIVLFVLKKSRLIRVTMGCKKTIVFEKRKFDRQVPANGKDDSEHFLTSHISSK